ncbi:E3 ubiquitin-protein ligase TRIM39-like [Mantella aurantiaca]
MAKNSCESIYNTVCDLMIPPDAYNNKPVSRASCQDENSTKPSTPAVTCTYCIYSVTPAIKSCLLCEASMCAIHLQDHSKAPEHVMTIPLRMQTQKCSIHKEVIKYYCFEDSAPTCVSCCLAGKHKGHHVLLLDEASEKKKKDLRTLLMRMTSKQNTVDMRVLKLKHQREEVQKRTAMVTERIATLFSDLRSKLYELEKRHMREVLAEEERICLPFTILINQLQKQQEELLHSITKIEKLINLPDPLEILTKTNSVKSLEPRDQENLIYDLEDIDDGLISVTLYRSINEIMETVKMAQSSSDLLLDVETAANNVYLSGDKKTISWSKINQHRGKQPTRFKSLQVLSTRSVLSGRHYWEVQTSESGEWMIGVCYPSMERKGTQSVFGSNNKSWCMSWKDKKLSVVHDQKVKHFLNLFPCRMIGIYLDYEAGRLSFYKLDDPIRHLHTFTATFNEPLFAAFSVQRAWLRIKT